MVCKYYRQTNKGKRCVFLSPKDWQLLKPKYFNMCQGDPKRCPIYNRYENLINSKDFYKKPQNSDTGLNVTPDEEIKPTKAKGDDVISEI
ncbi:MAG: hypothetical protein JHC26_01330 [Thermofilum sp.]|jgi:hypothetical protein|uniref:hypothetical protein n=1 Tax=Thermofilum sp. TaxID=1961369 RepID=UPI0025907855|nr:hypothetical protein [Thermofilum sp.]MCI4407702.1 hypothetical protein [Thermofilum sp.]